jgi:putative CocE/NonD family hydrolase
MKMNLNSLKPMAFFSRRQQPGPGLLALMVTFFLPGWLALPARGQAAPDFAARNYTKLMVRIPMRDGVRLHTTIYAPRDLSQPYPFLMTRTPYSTQPYDPDRFDRRLGPSEDLVQEKYIFVHQDVRGRWMSAGKYDNMRPHVPHGQGISESSDTYDTIEWLLNNVSNHNGKVGLWGISYPGFYTAAALPEHHPALVAASPQAPIADFFFDDFHHHGAFFQSYFIAVATFGYQHSGPTSQQWYRSIQPPNPDAWSFHTNLGPMSQAGRFYGPDNFFWKQLVEHPNYDQFWQARSILPHLKNVKTAVLTVGGLFDAEDLYGPFNIYRELEQHNPDIYNVLVMGPWSHGDWASVRGEQQVVGKVAFGPNQSRYYQREIEAPFFRHFLKGEGTPPAFEALVFDTGLLRWRTFSSWPPSAAEDTRFFFRDGQGLSEEGPQADDGPYSEFISDPANPVPYRKREDIRLQFTPRQYMSDDQRFAGQRSDVLIFQTEPLAEDLTLTGEVIAHLAVSTSEGDADWVVKLIDVLPDDHPFIPGSEPGLNFGGFQMMVRSEVMRGRFRNSYQDPQPFAANRVETVRFPLQGVCHTFKAGHRMMIQVQSTWFPLVDRNPQKYVDNIFKAKAQDFKTATHRVYHGVDASWIEVKNLPRGTE